MDESYVRSIGATLPEELLRLKYAGYFDEFEKRAQYHLDRDTLDILCPENAPVDEDPWSDDLDLLYERIPSETLEAAADWDVLQGAILDYANRHPEVFREPEEEKEGPQS